MLEKTLQNYRRDFPLRGYSPRTQNTYYRNIVWFLIHCDELPENITKERIKDYLYCLIKERML